MTENLEVPSETLAELFELLDYETETDLSEESEEVNGFRAVGGRHIDASRWMTRCILIFRRVSDGQLYGAAYQLGLTENQPNEYPWECGHTVECFPLWSYTKTITRIIYRSTPPEH